ncbi:MAG: glycosyltransferase family 4 protein [Negativicutes bacterium]|nr:glycosyltransferase family 4 protein [Negativicutes bacterium]
MRRLKLLLVAPTVDYPPRNAYYMRIVQPVLALAGQGRLEVDFLFYKNDRRQRRRGAAGLRSQPGVGQVAAVDQPLVSVEQTLDYMQFGREPAQVAALRSREMADRLTKMVAGGTYDIVQIEQSYMLWLVPVVRQASPAVRVVYGSHQLEWELWQRRSQADGEDEGLRRLYARQAGLLKEWETQAIGQADLALFIADRDRQRVCERWPELSWAIIPPAVDKGYFAVHRAKRPQYGVLYLGGLNWYPSVQGLTWFLSEVWPLLRAQCPGAGLHVVGSGEPYGRLREEMARAAGVTFWGYQSDERAFFSRARALVVPLGIAAGMRYKIAIAAACGTPVVATTVGAEGYDGQGIITADRPEDMARALARLIEDRDLNDRMSGLGREMAKRYALPRVVEQLWQAYCRVTGGA